MGAKGLVGEGQGLVGALLAIGIGANLMQASGIDASPHRLSRIASLTSRRNDNPPRLSRA